ncbi:MAG: phage holin family protein [Nocardioides sp.]
MATEQQPKTDEPSIGELVAGASRDISTLISKEIELAKSELKVSVTAGGLGVGLILGAVYVLTIGFVMLSVAIAFFINWNGSGLDLHWAFLIVFGVWALLAVLMTLIAVRSFKRVKAPEKAIAQGKQIPAALKGKSS